MPSSIAIWEEFLQEVQHLEKFICVILSLRFLYYSCVVVSKHSIGNTSAFHIPIGL